MHLAYDFLSVHFRPDPAFVPTVVGTFILIELKAFNLLLFASAKQEQLHTFCPIQTLQIYVDKTPNFGKPDHIFAQGKTSQGNQSNQRGFCFG